MYNQKVSLENIKSINNQEPASKNQIKNKKPDIIKNSNVLQGYIGNSINGGMIKPIAFAPVMAGTKIMDYRIRCNLKMLTPKAPAYQKLKAVFKCYFVPHSRVWKNYEKFIAQKGGNTTNKIEELPNIKQAQLAFLEAPGAEDATFANITDTDLWRDSWVSTYIPRFQSGLISTDGSTTKLNVFPPYSILQLRGFKAIYNDFERNKEYDEPMSEFINQDTGADELNQIIQNMVYFPVNAINGQHLIPRGKRQNSYYTNYRTELLGELENAPSDSDSDYLSSLVEFQKLVSEFRSQSSDSQLNDWDIIAKIRGSKKLTEGKVQLLGQKTIGLNYQSIPQTTYNINGTIQEDYQVLGAEGAMSFTEIDISLAQMQEIIEDGTLHVVMQITADTVFEIAFDRQLLNVKAIDQYRPDLKELKDDVLYEIEKCGTRLDNAEDITKVTGYKRKFNEYFKLPNAISGDIMTRGFYITKPDERNSGMNVETNDIGELVKTESKRQYQFFENDDKETSNFKPKNIWQDYTDILLNENSAIMQEIETYRNTEFPYLRIKGDNQINLIGMQTLIADLPIDENIKAGFTTWGEE